MRLHHFHTEMELPRPIHDVFAFFSDATNLEAITPPWLHFEILTPRPIPMKAGTIIDYRLRIHGFPVRWRTLIRVWDPPHRFVDEQVRGPYRLWVHEHRFVSCGPATRVEDRVQYAVPLDFLLHRLFVRRDLEEIFRFRAATLHQRFAGTRS